MESFGSLINQGKETKFVDSFTFMDRVLNNTKTQQEYVESVISSRYTQEELKNALMKAVIEM
jgi:heme oxygenase